MNFNMISRHWTPISSDVSGLTPKGRNMTVVRSEVFWFSVLATTREHLAEATLDFFIQTGHALFVGC